MRTILSLAACALALAACAAPAMNGGTQQAPEMISREDEPPVPPALRRPPRTLKNWGTTGSGGMY